MEAVGFGQPLPFAPIAIRGEKATVPVESHTSTYFRWREAKEREQAERANSPDVRDIYLSLAEWYRCLAENAEQLEGQEVTSRATHAQSTPWD